MWTSIGRPHDSPSRCWQNASLLSRYRCRASSFSICGHFPQLVVLGFLLRFIFQQSVTTQPSLPLGPVDTYPFAYSLSASTTVGCRSSWEMAATPGRQPLFVVRVLTLLLPYDQLNPIRIHCRLRVVCLLVLRPPGSCASIVRPGQGCRITFVRPGSRAYSRSNISCPRSSGTEALKTGRTRIAPRFIRSRHAG